MRQRIASWLRHRPWLMAALYRMVRLFQTKYTVGVVGVLRDENGRILLVEHVFHPLHPWGLPGGWVNRREDPASAVERELAEELGLHVKARQVLLAEFHHGYHLDVAYACTTDEQDITHISHELLGYRWFSPDDMPPLHVFHRRAIAHMLSQPDQKAGEETEE